MILGRLTLYVFDPSRTVFNDPAHLSRSVEDVHRVHITVIVFCEYFGVFHNIFENYSDDHGRSKIMINTQNDSLTEYYIET